MAPNLLANASIDEAHLDIQAHLCKGGVCMQGPEWYVGWVSGWLRVEFTCYMGALRGEVETRDL